MRSESYADLAKPKKPPSLARSFMLALLMLFGVFLLSPIIDMMRETKTKVGLTEDVEMPEPEVIPELPEAKPLLPPEKEVLPILEDGALTTVDVRAEDEPMLEVGSGSVGLLNPMGEIEAIAGLSRAAPAAGLAPDALPDWLYPRLEGGVAGSALLEVAWDAEGRVESVKVLRTASPEFAREAAAILRGARVDSRDGAGSRQLELDAR